MSELTNKELSKYLKDVHQASKDAFGAAFFDKMLLAAERLAAMPDPMPDFVETGNEIIDFLLGSGEFMGKWYGEGPPEGHTGNFWWRQYLKSYVDAIHETDK